MRKIIVWVYFFLLCVFVHSGLLFELNCATSGTWHDICIMSKSWIEKIYLQIDIGPAFMNAISIFFVRVEALAILLLLLDTLICIAPFILRMALIFGVVAPMLMTFGNLQEMAGTLISI